MKVLQANNFHYMRGGSDALFMTEIALLREKGHPVAVLSSASEKNVESPGDHAFVQNVDLESPGLQDAMRYFWSRPARAGAEQLIESFRPDIAHLHIYYSQLTTAILGPLRKRGIPIVQTLHEYRLICPTDGLFANGKVCERCVGRSFWQAAGERCHDGSTLRSLVSVAEATVSRWTGDVKGIDHFIAVSDFVKRKMVEGGLDGNRITTVHNFLPAGDEPAAASGTGRVVFLGRLAEGKGLMTLLRAAVAQPTLPFAIVGDGPLRRRVEDRIERDGIGNVKLLGSQRGQALDAILAESLCVVVPSESYETFGLAALEAYRHARPVVASRIGGLPEVVTDGATGYLVEPGDAVDLGEAIRRLHDQPDAAREMGWAGRRLLVEQFSPERHYEQLVSVYRQML